MGFVLVIGARREAEGTQEDAFLLGAFAFWVLLLKCIPILGLFNMSILKCIFLYRVNCVRAILESYLCKFGVAPLQT